MPPIKFQASGKEGDRVTKKVSMVHHYIKNTPKDELIKYINDGQKPKIKQKCRNELVRRGIEIVYVDKE